MGIYFKIMRLEYEVRCLCRRRMRRVRWRWRARYWSRWRISRRSRASCAASVARGIATNPPR